MTEIWKKIPGWPSYSVSSLGRVRRDIAGNKRKAGILCIRRRRGYPSVFLIEGKGPGKQRFIHVFMLEAFVGMRPKGQEARHLDDVKTHNTLDNLQWGTRSQNMGDRTRNGVARGFLTYSSKEFKQLHDKMPRNRLPFGAAVLPKSKRIEIAAKRVATMRRNNIPFGVAASSHKKLTA